MCSAIAVLMYYTLIRSPSFPYVPDCMFLIPVWGPEIINFVVDSIFKISASSLLLYWDSTHTYTVDKDEKYE
jgi:hypothetical protein